MGTYGLNRGVSEKLMESKYEYWKAALYTLSKHLSSSLSKQASEDSI